MNTPDTHPREEEAAAYVFGQMEAAERIAFVKAMNEDVALRALVDELSLTAAGLALDIPQVTPPSAVRDRVLQGVKSIAQDGTRKPMVVPTTAKRSPMWLGWAAAVVLLLPTAMIWRSLQDTQKELATYKAQAQEFAAVADKSARIATEAIDKLQQVVAKLNESDKTAKALEAQLAQGAKTNEALQQQLAKVEASNQSYQQELAKRAKANEDLKVELAHLIKVNDSAQMQIATLQSTVKEYKQGVAVVVWNSEKQEGILRLEKMPPVDSNKDYQLWVVDPKQVKPVNAGIVKVDEQGFAKVQFKPTIDVSKADKFALSVEKKGGVPQNEGPIILLSN
jgi:anti-sigma-K factor RskA